MEEAIILGIICLAWNIWLTIRLLDTAEVVNDVYKDFDKRIENVEDQTDKRHDYAADSRKKVVELEKHVNKLIESINFTIAQTTASRDTKMFNNEERIMAIEKYIDKDKINDAK